MWSFKSTVVSLKQVFEAFGRKQSLGAPVVSFKRVVKGYQACLFDVKEGEEFKVLKKIG